MNVSRSEPPLYFALQALLPTPVETQLLRGCLLPAVSGRNAWHAWRGMVSNSCKVFEDNKTGLKGLLPMVRKGLERTGDGDDKELLTYARAAYLHEVRRYAAYSKICARVLTELNNAQIPVIALKACVIAETAYEVPTDRHNHALDLLVSENDRGRAGAAIEAAEFTKTEFQLRPGPDHVSYRHRHGLPLELHSRLFALPHYDLSLDQIRGRSEQRPVASVPAQVLSPADNLLHICGLAAGERTRENLRWACDGWSIVTSHPELDWTAFLDMAESSGLALPLYVQLRYLAQALDAPVPDDVLDKLRESALSATAQDREAALFGAVVGLGSARRSLFHPMAGWRSRLEVFKYIVAPTPNCLRWSFPTSPGVLLPLLYPYRPIRYAFTRLLGRLYSNPYED